MDQQRTLKSAAHCAGVGVHSGQAANLTIRPADKNTGFVFVRTDITDKNNRIVGLWDNVTETRLCTVLSNDEGATISTVEHVLSALAACGVDNAILEIDGPEIPIMDGSAQAFLDMIDNVGTIAQDAQKRYILVKKPISFEEDGKIVTLMPSLDPHWHMNIDFDSQAIGQQHHSFDNSLRRYRTDIADCRTFGFLQEVEMLQKMGLARGGSLENAIVIDGDDVLNPGGLRHKTEFVRHKILDAIGDIILAGAPVLADYHGNKAGHAMNNKVLHALFQDKEAFEFISAARLSQLQQKQTHNSQQRKPQPAYDSEVLSA